MFCLEMGYERGALRGTAEVLEIPRSCTLDGHISLIGDRCTLADSQQEESAVRSLVDRIFHRVLLVCRPESISTRKKGREHQLLITVS